MKPALLVIDMQEKFFQGTGPEVQSLNAAAEYINAAIAIFRKKQLPVIAVLHKAPEMALLPGAEGFEFPDKIEVLPTDPHIHKEHGNAFFKTELETMLREMGVDTVILTGYCAEYCVLSTYRGAEDLDLHPILMRGALASGVAENIRFIENISALISYGALQAIL